MPEVGVAYYKKLKKEIENNSPNEFNLADALSGYYVNTTFTSNNDWKTTGYVKVNEGDTIRVNEAYQTLGYAYDTDKNSLEQIGGTFYSPTEFIYVVPANCEYITINVYIDYWKTFMLTINTQLPEVYTPYFNKKYKFTLLSENNFYHQLIATIGTSITLKDDWEAYDGYQKIIQNNLELYYNNYGYSGKPIADGTSNGDGIVTLAKSIDYSKYSLVTLEIGTNDFKLDVSLGNKGQIGDTSFDTTTFYGAYRELIEYILNINPEVRIVLLTPLQRDNSGYDVNYTNSAGHKLIDYVNAVEEIGEMYSLPVCDLYRKSGITQKTLSTFTEDGLHPNNLGYKRIGNLISSFLNLLFRLNIIRI